MIQVFGLVIVAVIAISLVRSVFDDPESRRKRRGLDQYRIKVVENYECGEVKDKRYYIEQRMKTPILFRIFLGDYKPWVKLQEYTCGMSDCYWTTTYFKTLESAEKAIEKIRIENSTFNGQKTEIIKYIP